MTIKITRQVAPSPVQSQFPHIYSSQTVHIRRCRICGCTEDHACYDPQRGPCWWVAPDLCSHCEGSGTVSREKHPRHLRDELNDGAKLVALVIIVPLLIFVLDALSVGGR